MLFRSDLENRQQGVANQRGLVAMMREQFSDERQADAAARMNYIEMGKMHLAELAQRGSPRNGAVECIHVSNPPARKTRPATGWVPTGGTWNRLTQTRNQRQRAQNRKR